MSERGPRIDVTASDSASPVLAKIGQNAKKLGRDAAGAGTGFKGLGNDAKDAGRKLSEVERDLIKTSSAMVRAKVSATEVGAAFGTVVAGLAKLGQASVSEEQQIRALGRAYGDSTQDILALSDAIQDNTVYSDDQARSAAQLASTLRREYGFTTAEIELLIERSADLAAVSVTAQGGQISLIDAVSRTTAALRGETEAAEQLGLTLNQQAIDREGVTLSMTNQEAAHFRFNELLRQSAVFEGAAGEQAKTAAGRTRQYLNSLQDLAQEAGDVIGPVGEVASVLGDYGLATIGVSAAVGNLAKVSQAAAPAVLGLATRLGPLGLVAAGVGAVAILGEMTDWMGIFGDSVPEAERQVNSLTDAIYALNAAGAADDLVIAAEAIETRWQAVGAALNVVSDQTAAQAQASIDLNNAIRSGASQEVIDGIIGRINSLTAAYDTGVFENVTANITELTQRLDDADVNTSKLLGDINEQIRQFEAGEITLDQMNATVGAMVANFNQWYVVLPQATAATNDFTTALERLVGIDFDQFDLDIFLRNIGAAQREAQADGGVAGFFVGLGEAAGEAGRQINGELRVALQEVPSALQQIKADTTAYAAELRAAQQSVIDYIASGENLLELLYESGKALSGEQGFLSDVIDLDNALTGLERTYNIIIGGTERLGATSGDLAAWAQGLIDAGNAGPALDSLNQIIAANAEVQADILAIQQAQAPYLAALNAETAAYVDTLAQQDAQQQRNVLTMMDANSQQQIPALYAAATAAEMGELGSQGTRYVNDMAASLKVTNPLLYDMLVSSGAIKETAKGIEFNFDEVDASALVTTLDTLNTTLEDLTALIAEINGLTIGPKIDPSFSAAIAGFRKPTGNTGAGDGTGITGNAGSTLVGDGTGGPWPGGGGEVRGDNIRVGIELDKTNFEAQVNDARAEIEALAGDGWSVWLGANNDNLVGVVEDSQGRMVALVSDEYVLPIDADGDPAIGASNDVKGVVLELVNGTYVARINGDGTLAHSEINAANDALNALNGTTGVIYIRGDGSSARNTINALTGYQGDAYINVRYNQAGGIGFTPFRDGGVVGYDAAALDGIVTKHGMRRIMVGEAGPEYLNVPPGSSVIPAPMTRAIEGGERRRGRGGLVQHFRGITTVIVQDSGAASRDAAARMAVRR